MMKISIRNVLLSSVLMVVMMAMAADSWHEFDDDDDDFVNKPIYLWHRASRSRKRCVNTGHRCDTTTPCCSNGDICLTGTQTDVVDGSRITQCVTWSESLAINPRLPRGTTCTESWACQDRCCREYRPNGRTRVYECGTPLNSATCTDSWECAHRCCREYRAHRHDVVLECGTPFDGLEWHTCITDNA